MLYEMVVFYSDAWCMNVMLRMARSLESLLMEVWETWDDVNWALISFVADVTPGLKKLALPMY